MRKFYQKEIPEAPVYVAGHPLTFELLETEDSALINELDKCASRGIGGVLEISEATYQEELKKKANGTHLNSSSRPKHQRTELSAVQLAGLRAVGAEGKVGQFARPQMPDHKPHNRHGLPKQGGPGPAPDPIDVPTAESFGPIARPPTVKAKDLK